MQPRTKEMPSAANRARKTGSNPDVNASSDTTPAERKSSSPEASSNAKQSQDRKSSPQASAEEIARRAYLHWESEGKPHGKDLDHWVRAKAELERTAP